MWIRTQDKKHLLKNPLKLSISKNFGSKHKAAIVAEYESNSIFGNQQLSIGQFLTEKEALEELTNIENFIRDISTGVYQVK